MKRADLYLLQKLLIERLDFNPNVLYSRGKVYSSFEDVLNQRLTVLKREFRDGRVLVSGFASNEYRSFFDQTILITGPKNARGKRNPDNQGRPATWSDCSVSERVIIRFIARPVNDFITPSSNIMYDVIYDAITVVLGFQGKLDFLEKKDVDIEDVRTEGAEDSSDMVAIKAALKELSNDSSSIRKEQEQISGSIGDFREDIKKDFEEQKRMLEPLDELLDISRKWRDNFLSDKSKDDSQSDYRQLLKAYDQKSREKAQKMIQTDVTEFMSAVFNDLLKAREIDPDLRNRTEMIMGDIHSKHEFGWPYLAVLASALSLSVLNEWDLRKVQLLKRLAEFEEVPIVSRRAILGLALALIMTGKDTTKFEKTLKAIAPLKRRTEVRSGLYECLHFFLEKLRTLEFDEEIRNYPKDHTVTMHFQWFEVPHRRVSLTQLNVNLAFGSKDEIRQFFKLLSGSISLTEAEQMKVLFAMNRLSLEQNNELIKIFTEELQNFHALSEDHLFDVEHLKFKRVIEPFVLRLSEVQEFSDLAASLKNVLEMFEMNQSERLTAMFDQFPYVPYANYLDANKALNHPDITDAYSLEYLGDFYRDMEGNSHEDRVINYINALKCYERIPTMERSAYVLRQIGWCNSKIAGLNADVAGYGEAIEAYSESLKLEQYAFAYLQIGWCYSAIGKLESDSSKYELAIKAFRNSFKLEKTAWTYLQIGWCYSNIGELETDPSKYEQAIKAYRSSLKLERTASAHRQIGWCYSAIGKLESDSSKYELAIKAFRNSLKLEKTAWTYLQIGLCLFRIGELETDPSRYEQSIRAYRSSLKLDETQKVLHHIGWNYFLLYKPKQAMKYFKECLRIGAHKHAHMNSGHCELMFGNEIGALEHYKQSLDLWNCSDEFFDGFDEDFVHMEQLGVGKDKYGEIRKELVDYCSHNG